MRPLLIHSGDVPAEARDALKRAQLGPPEEREAFLASAARILYRETDLDCSEALELVGLPPWGNCA